jgi:hypothetical protein
VRAKNAGIAVGIDRVGALDDDGAWHITPLKIWPDKNVPRGRGSVPTTSSAT